MRPPLRKRQRLRVERGREYKDRSVTITHLTDFEEVAAREGGLGVGEPGDAMPAHALCDAAPTRDRLRGGVRRRTGPWRRWITGGSPSLLRSRLMVILTVAVNGRWPRPRRVRAARTPWAAACDAYCSRPGVATASHSEQRRVARARDARVDMGRPAGGVSMWPRVVLEHSSVTGATSVAHDIGACARVRQIEATALAGPHALNWAAKSSKSAARLSAGCLCSRYGRVSLGCWTPRNRPSSS